MPESPITYRGAVYPWHCDHIGHMNVMWYVGKFDEATWQFFNMLGLTPSYLRTAQRGMAAVDQHVSYLQELHAGDLVTVRTTLLELKNKSIRFVHVMTHDESNQVVARTTLKAVHMDTEERKSCGFPESITTQANAVLAVDPSGSVLPQRAKDKGLATSKAAYQQNLRTRKQPQANLQPKGKAKANTQHVEPK